MDAFHHAATTVTWALWNEYVVSSNIAGKPGQMLSKPTWDIRYDHPVVNVSWIDSASQSPWKVQNMNDRLAYSNRYHEPISTTWAYDDNANRSRRRKRRQTLTPNRYKPEPEKGLPNAAP